MCLQVPRGNSAFGKGCSWSLLLVWSCRRRRTKEARTGLHSTHPPRSELGNGPNKPVSPATQEIKNVISKRKGIFVYFLVAKLLS